MRPRLSHTTGVIIGLAITFLLLIIMGGSKNAHGETFTVDDDGGADYSTIQNALDDADWGDTIRVWEGTYYGNAVVHRTVNVIGNGSDVTIMEGGGISIQEDSVLISDIGFVNGTKALWTQHSYVEIRNVSTRHQSDSGIILNTFASHCTIQDSKFMSGEVGVRVYGPKNHITNCDMDGNEHGIYIEDGEGNVVTNCSFTNSSSSGFFLGEGGTQTWLSSNIASSNRKGILVYGHDNMIEKNVCENNTLSGILLGSDSNENSASQNTCTGNGIGIEFEFAFNSTAERNSLNVNEIGLYILEGEWNQIQGNDIRENEKGISLRRTQRNTMYENTVVENSIGIHLFNDSRENSINGNLIEGNRESGIHIRSSHQTSVNANLITLNEQGMFIESTSTDTTVRENDFVGNSKYGLNALFNDGWGITATINYWGDYAGPYMIGDNELAIGDAVTDGVIMEPWSHFPHTYEVPRCRITGVVSELRGHSIGFTDIIIRYHELDHTVTADISGNYESGDLPCSEDQVTIFVTLERYQRYERSIVYKNDTSFNIELLAIESPIEITLINPNEGDSVSGAIDFFGEVTVTGWDDPSITVQLLVDDGEWVNMSENATFRFDYPVVDLERRIHTFSVRATDGWYLSNEITRHLMVQDEEEDGFEFTINTMIFIGIIVLCGVGMVVLARRFSKIMESWFGVKEKKVEQWKFETSEERGIRERLKEKIEIRKQDSRERQMELDAIEDDHVMSDAENAQSNEELDIVALSREIEKDGEGMDVDRLVPGGKMIVGAGSLKNGDDEGDDEGMADEVQSTILDIHDPYAKEITGNGDSNVEGSMKVKEYPSFKPPEDDKKN